VKRSGRDKSVWVVIHMCMEVMLGISLYSYPYLKLPKTLCLSYFCLCVLFNKIREEGKQVLPGCEGGGGIGSRRQWGEMTQTMFVHMNK
jgi:hypothetical protein